MVVYFETSASSVCSRLPVPFLNTFFKVIGMKAVPCSLHFFSYFFTWKKPIFKKYSCPTVFIISIIFYAVHTSCTFNIYCICSSTCCSCISISFNSCKIFLISEYILLYLIFSCLLGLITFLSISCFDQCYTKHTCSTEYSPSLLTFSELVLLLVSWKSTSCSCILYIPQYMTFHISTLR